MKGERIIFETCVQLCIVIRETRNEMQRKRGKPSAGQVSRSWLRSSGIYAGVPGGVFLDGKSRLISLFLCERFASFCLR